jgi:hypothetical protein
MGLVMARRPNFEKERVLNDDELAQLKSNLAHLSESGVRDFYQHAHRDCAIIGGHFNPTARHGLEAVEEVAKTVTVPLVLRNRTRVPFLDEKNYENLGTIEASNPEGHEVSGRFSQ